MGVAVFMVSTPLTNLIVDGGAAVDKMIRSPNKETLRPNGTKLNKADKLLDKRFSDLNWFIDLSSESTWSTKNSQFQKDRPRPNMVKHKK